MIKTFDTWVSGERLNKAIRLCSEQATTRIGQEEILAEAASGDTIAADYIYYRLKGVIAKAFWKYYMGPDKGYWKQKIESGADRDFASIAYEMLVGQSEVSPYKTFKPGKFSAKTDVIKLFGYYFFRYLQSEVFKILRSDKKFGMTGNVGKEDNFSVESYNDDNENARGEKTAVGDTFTNDIDMQDVVRRFLAKLKKENITYYNIFKARLSGLSVDETAAKLGISKGTVRTRLEELKDIYKDFIGE